MTVLAAIRSEEDVGTPIVRDVRVFPILRAEVRRAVAGVEVVGKIVFTPGAHVGRMGLVAIHKRPRTFRLLRVARISDEVDELERVRVVGHVGKARTTKVREGRGVTGAAVHGIAREVLADHGEEDGGQYAASVLFDVEPILNVTECALVVRSSERGKRNVRGNMTRTIRPNVVIDDNLGARLGIRVRVVEVEGAVVRAACA
mmetsp:Transcript_15735/g.33858  ORF Transcript_15735/g.33858 Transcript_15735/m.33858 type:complete len:202 (+) Transcript_15735:524-1129(+)